MELADYVNDLPPSSRLGTLGNYLQEEELASPADMYQRTVGQILREGTSPRLEGSEIVGRLLVVGLVSAAEAYFRAVLAACIELCPVAQSAAASSNRAINLGGLLWHGRAGFSRTAFEHSSFTSRDELVKTCKDFLGIVLDDKVFRGPLNEYEDVCQLRHGIVHGDGLLPGKNAVRLNIPRYRKPVRIRIRYEHLQEVASVINTLVMTFNRYLFLEMCKRWAIDWRQREDWEPSLERSSFNQICRIFCCNEELKRRPRKARFSREKCYEALKAQYDL